MKVCSVTLKRSNDSFVQCVDVRRRKILKNVKFVIFWAFGY